MLNYVGVLIYVRLELIVKVVSLCYLAGDPEVFCREVPDHGFTFLGNFVVVLLWID
jgi:hypothetical protein